MAKLKTKKKKASAEPDELISFGQQLWLRLQERPKEAIMIAGGIAGILLLALLGLFIRDRAEAKRIQSVAALIERYHDESGRDAEILVPELRDAAQKYSRFFEGAEALYYLGHMRAEAGDLAEAAEAYSSIRSEYGAHEMLATAAALGLAYTNLLDGKEEEALGLFEQLLEKEDGAFPRSQVLLEIGGISERLGNSERAAEAYREVVESYPETAFATVARERLSALGS